jgi:Putative peptidoglycan binding domain
MKTFITVLISCSLMLGATAMAQQDEEQQKAKKEKKSQQTSQAQAQPQASAAAGAQRGAKRGKGAAAATESANVNAGQERGKQKGKAAAHAEAATSPAATENANVNATTQEGGKRKGKRAEAATSPAATENANVNATTQEGGKRKGKRAEAAMKQGSPSPAAAAGTSAAVSGGGGTKPTKAGNVGKNGKQVNVQQIKGQHTNFRAQAKPQQIKTVTYNQNYRIVGAERWQGPQYEVFRAYTPAWHDSGWYRSNFSRVELIGGGYYYFNNGYWYPAWGYDPGAQYYAYDGPIYVGQRAEPPDQVIADVQAELKDMGYYTGEVDGLLGPLTREALTAYQGDHGLYTTAAIDEPTLDALGMS